MLGFFGALSRAGVLAAGAAALGLVAFAVVRRRAHRAYPPHAHAEPVAGPGSRLFAAGLVLGVLAVSAPVLVQPLYPPTAWDSISYHLASVARFEAAGSVVLTLELRFASFPLGWTMLFTAAHLFGGAAAAQLVSFLGYLAVALVLFVWGRHEGSARGGTWAAALWLGSPMALFLGATAFVDMGVAVFLLAAAFALRVWHENRSGGVLALAGALAGVAAGVKYPGLFFVLVFGVWVALAALPRRRLAAAFQFFAVALVVAAPWYLRNAALTGDPFFPFLPELFPTPYWSPDDVGLQRTELASHGIARDALSPLRIWWELAANQGRFRLQSLSSLAWIVPAPLLLALVWRHAPIRAVVGLAIVWIAVWLASAQEMRYLVYVLPFLCLALGLGLDRALVRVPALASEPGRSLAGAVLALAVLSPSWFYARGEIDRLGWPPAEPHARERYLARRLPEYAAISLLNRTHGGKYTLYQYHASRMAYFARGRFLGDVFGPWRERRIEPFFEVPSALHHELRAMGADHFLVSHRQGEVPLRRDAEFRRRFRLRLVTSEAALYRLRPLESEPAP